MTKKSNKITINANEPFNPDWIQSVQRDLVKKIQWWMYKSATPIAETAEELASKAIAYVLKPGLTGKGPLPNNKDQLFWTAKRFARFGFLDAIKQAKKAPASLDDREMNEEGDEPETCNEERRYSMEKYNEDMHKRKWREMGRTALALLPGFLRKHRVSNRDIAVYMDYVLFEVPTEGVTEKYGIKAGNLYRIVCIVNGILRCHGKDFLKGLP